MGIRDLQPDAARHWRKADAVMARLSKANPIPLEPVIKGGDGFAALVQSITHQQVSLAAGQTIHGRVVALLGGKVTPQTALRRTPEELRTAGLSRSKAGFILDLADKTERGDVEFARFPRMADEAVIEELTAVKGIGVWTAKMFLMFHLERPDVLAPEDLGLRLGVADAYGVAPEKAASFMLDQGPAWSPYNTVAARVLWLSRRRTMDEAKATATGTVRATGKRVQKATGKAPSKRSSRRPVSSPP